MTDTGVALGFWGLSALTIGAALMIILSRNLLHAVLFLVLSFVGLAGLFLTLTADFIAVAQVLIYAGAVGVLAIFAVMLTPSGARRNADTGFFGFGFITGGLVAAVMAYVAFRVPWPETDNEGFDSTVALIGDALVNRWALPFEIASVVLIVAMIGALVLVRSDLTNREAEAAEPVPDIAENQLSSNEGELVASGAGHDVGRA